MLRSLSLPAANRLRAVARRTAEPVPFVLAHVACFAAIWTGVHAADVALAAALYAVRMFGVTAGYHRYFSHRTFKTGRLFQFVLAFVAQSSAQRGILWWAANHRHHHRYSDADEDVHSPVLRTFWYAHVGWIFDDKNDKTDLAAVRDLAKFPELVWLDRHRYVPPMLLGAAVLAVGGWSGLVVGFFWSTVALWHATFAINSVAHLVGRRRYLTGDHSRNNWWLALVTFGEGWHNNHHHYQGAACQGFRWYEVDLTYYALKALAALRLVSDLRTPPAHVVHPEGAPNRAVVERAARHLAGSLHAERERIVADLRSALAGRIGGLHDGLASMVENGHQRLEGNLDAARRELADFVQRFPSMPSPADLRARAAAMFVRTPSMNDIAERARQLLVERVCEEVLGRLAQAQPAKA